MPSVLLATLQFFFALTWIVYVIYLPALAAQAGLDKRYVPMILMMDQLVFLACDWLAGVYADRVAELFGRIGGTMAIATLVSCGAFIALPWVAPGGSPVLFLFLTILWSATSSAVRAPPFALVSRHFDADRQPWIVGIYLFGLGIASAIAPYVGIELKQIDPHIPFAASSLGLALLAWALSSAERRWPELPAVPQEEAAVVARGPLILFAVAVFLFALGFQVHFAINSATSYLRFARMEDLPKLMPIFWIGFNLAILPATLMPKRFGGTPVLVAAGVLGVVAYMASVHVRSLDALVIAQGIAGAAWAIALMSAFTAALEVGTPGREGFLTGILFSVLAAAALARLALITVNAQAHATIGPQLPHVPFVAWALGAFIIAIVAYRATRAD
jgi:MFS family permease